MKKFMLAAITAAVATGWVGTALAVDLNTGAGALAYANELVVNNTTLLNGITATNKLGFGVSGGQTRYVRYDLTNATLVNVAAPANLTLNPAAANTVVSQGGAAGGNFVIFQITADPAGNGENSPVGYVPGALKVTDKAGSPVIKYSLYETAADANAGGAAGLLATASAAVATFPSGLTFSAVTNSTTAEVSKLYNEFNNGVTATLAKIGTLTYAPNQTVRRPDNGNLLVPPDINLFTAAGTKLVLTGTDLSAAKPLPAGLFIAAAANCGGGVAYAGSGLTPTTVDFVINVNAIGTSNPPAATGLDICFDATGTTPIAAQSFTVSSVVVPNPASTTANAGPIAAGEFKRNGTVLKHAFADTTSASGVTMAVHMTNTGGIPAPYTVRCLLNNGSAAGTPGTVPANTAVRQSVVNGLGCTGNGTLRGIELTFAVPEGNVIGAVVRQNVSTGAASFDTMIGSSK